MRQIPLPMKKSFPKNTKTDQDFFLRDERAHISEIGKEKQEEKNGKNRFINRHRINPCHRE
ncbi:hypothetical protein HQ39_00610 [Porphyromonas sp. COT-108 OH2963]|nr:hypothetical protein HQ39_00610 [Porphyromonas sp. COT-108 OH2963]